MEEKKILVWDGDRDHVVPFPKARPTLNWDARIRRAEKKGKFTWTDKAYAQDWCTCSLGESVPWCSGDDIASKLRLTSYRSYTRDTYKGLGRRIEELGIAFSNDVLNDNPKRAKQTRIEMLASIRAYHGMRC